MAWRIPASLRCVQCAVCGMTAEGGLSLCATCAGALPWQPPGCLRCGEPRPPAALHRGLCGGCIAEPPTIDRCRSALSYEPPMDTLLHRFKFHGDFACGRVLAHLLTAGLTGPRSAARSAEEPTVAPTPPGTLLVPIPLHPSRQRQRGFNQARELARPLQKALGTPLSLRALTRRRRTHAQWESPTPAERRRNLRGAFRVNKAALRGVQRVILIDDVITTMSTVQAAATTLKRAGVPEVEAWSVLRANEVRTGT